MLRAFSLLLPALIPSWRFFASVAPSPRIRFAVVRTRDDEPSAWQAFRPRPARLTLVQMGLRLFWNPRGNETLFATACAERFLTDGSSRALDPLLTLVLCDVTKSEQVHTQNGFVLVRIVLRYRDHDMIREEEVYRSEPIAIAEGDRS